MDFKIIIWLAIIAFIGMMGGGKKKSSEQQPARRNAAGQPGTPRPKVPAMEATQSANQQRDVLKVQRQSTQKEYFTYEKPVDWNREHQSAPILEEEETPVENPLSLAGGFDLRKALIYQTILQNNYITDLK